MKSGPRGRVKLSAPPFEGIGSGPTLQYAVVPDDLPFVNRGRFWSGDQLVEKAPRLAITRDFVTGEAHLLFCDEKWQILHGIGAASVDEARREAESFYPGLERHWVDLGITDVKAEAYMERLRRSQGCSFCRRAPAEHGGTQFQVRRTRICGDCVRNFHAQLEKDEGS
jgi:hypothetical protein